MKAQDMPGTKKDAGESAENPLLSLGLNILIPVIILMRFSAEDRLGPVYGLLVALAFPVIYGLYDFTRRRNFNLFSALGFVGILLTGGVGLLKLGVQWIAIKEASIPLIVGIVVLGSLKTRFPLVRKLLGKMIKLDRVDAALREKGTAEVFERQLVRATYIVGASFFLSALLNYVLAKIIVVSPAGTTAFNEELGRMTLLSFPVIAVPSTIVLAIAVMYLCSGIAKLTDLDVQSLLLKKKPPDA